MTEREALERTYRDKVTVVRRIDAANGASPITRQVDTVIAEQLPCALSVNKLGGLVFVEGHGQMQSSFTLFCAPDTPVQSGDLLRVSTSAGQSFTLWAGRAFCYPSHTEVPTGEELQ